ncbi:MAG TPA: DNA mismatch repair protein MutS, partial [Elusimicrobiales bacterium]|nr:DNA mismatch repair protein MutS [Elusimicrobiales bacterium]
AENKSKETPLMKQYKDIKAKYPDAFVFFRLGDFYEMFYEDAAQASKILSLVLTKRSGVPMCGIPYHSSANYIAKLLKSGNKVAICEQMETPQEAKSKLVKRKVVRVITPGTVTEDELLDSAISNHLVCVNADALNWGLACIEVSTGNFWASQAVADDNLHRLSGLIARINPSEILADEQTIQELRQKNIINGNSILTKINAGETSSPPENWQSTFVVKENKNLALKSALNACRYVEGNEPRLSGQLVPKYREYTNYLHLDENAIRTLELVESEHGGRKGTLWGILNNCLTSMGARLMREWILHPLINPKQINERQNCVEELMTEEKRESLGKILENVSDIERIITRITAMSASPRDVGALRDSLKMLDPITDWLKNSNIKTISKTVSDIYDRLNEMFNILSNAIDENPPIKLGEGKTIRQGYNTELDELRCLKNNTNVKLKELQENEKKKTGIPSLKVGYNSVFGYYIEVTKTHMSKVPYEYIRKQTLVNCERFITQELKEMESLILGAEDKIARLENHLFNEVRKKLTASADILKTFAVCVAELDVYMSLACAAVKGHYIKPEINLSNDLIIKGGRHPIAEKAMRAGEFISNDLEMAGDFQIMMLTGPNMSGKSVYLRQNALIVIMAQMGSFVPSESAVIGIKDRIMTRIGAKDIMAKGESTFMVEMKETAAILDLATSKSLVLLDEVGRGTSTFDGISIAWAVVEFLYDLKQGPKVLFATHYFELTEMEQKYNGIKNFNVSIKESVTPKGKTELIFLHKVLRGPSDKSYGIHVAEIAGINAACTLRAKQILKNLEEKTNLNGIAKEESLPLLQHHPVMAEINDCRPEKLTPLEALQTINEWKKRLKHE